MDIDKPKVAGQGDVRKRALQGALSLLVVVVIFGFALPRVANFGDVWTQVREMTWLELTTLLVAALWNIVTYWFVLMSSLPGSNVWQTMKVNQASTAVSNSLPGGGALGVGVTYAMYSQYGFSKSEISLSILVTGIWNNFVKLGMPVAALAFVALEGGASGGLIVASLVGLGVLALAVGLFAMALKSEQAARAIGNRLGRAVGAIRKSIKKPRTADLGRAFVAFRRDAIGLLSRRWLPLSGATLASHLSLFLVLLLTLRHVGVSQEQVSWAQALAAFAFTRLISAIPITPGGLGVVELGMTAALVAAGGPKAEVVAAVLVFRALTYVLPIPVGGLLYLQWQRGSASRRARLEESRELLAKERPA